MSTLVLDRNRYMKEMTNEIVERVSKTFFGYRLSMKSQREWAEYERQERIKQAVVDKARAMIEWSHAEYEGAKLKHQRNLKTFAELTLNWSPERVMSTHKDFKGLCRALQNEQIWKMLSRKERAFIADAVSQRY